MSYQRLLANLHFDSDPFAKTNADEEERLESYFVSPPFFNAVYGVPSMPKSAVVFAPRGGGKTALKRKIESITRHEMVLCISYNSFDTTDLKLSQVDLHFHLRHIVQRILVGVVTAAYLLGVDELDKEDRRLLYLFVKEYLSRIDKRDMKTAIDSVKNLTDKAKEVWNRFTGPVAVVANGLLERLGFGTTEIRKFEDEDGKLGPLDDQIRILQEISSKLGYKCIYVLIDRVDETSITGSASNSYKFISPLVSDLQLLESPGIAYKFFLWNSLLNDYRTIARPDRIKYYELGWDYDDLRRMLSVRLRAFSRNRVSSFESIADSELHLPLSLDKFIAILAQGSPRNLVRICKEILDQQSEIDPSVNLISAEAIEMGLRRIADNIARESYSDSVIKDLQRTKRCDFTIRHIYGDVFKVTQPAALNKVKAWEAADAVQLLGTIQETKKVRFSNHYGLANVLLAMHIFGQMPISDFIAGKIRTCSVCKKVLLRDWDLRKPQHCHHCQQEMC